MAKKKPTAKASVPVDALKHPTDTRPNIPTRETAAFAADDGAKTVLYPRDTSLDPQLVWKGKDEQDTKPLEVPAVPIHVQEKIHPQAIVEDVKNWAKRGKPVYDLFADFNGLDDFSKKLEFYQHDQHWTNRLILGDSLLVMASLAEKERLRGKVQCVYFDPPYGIKFGSNWQVSTRKRDVKDAKAEDLTRQPEQIQAFRDTWERGIHSYLTVLRDRLAAARDLLTESGSIFVQIGDENVHLMRCLMDEVFGSENFVVLITVQKTGAQPSELLAGVADPRADRQGDCQTRRHRDALRPALRGQGHCAADRAVHRGEHVAAPEPAHPAGRRRDPNTRGHARPDRELRADDSGQPPQGRGEGDGQEPAHHLHPARHLPRRVRPRRGRNRRRRCRPRQHRPGVRHRGRRRHQEGRTGGGREGEQVRPATRLRLAFEASVHEQTAELTKEIKFGKLAVLPVRMNPDLAMGDELLKKTGAGNLFTVFGEPDVKLDRTADGKMVVTIRGVDVFDPGTGEVRTGDTDDIACWFIDTDYDGQSFFVRHAYFLYGGKDTKEAPYDKLKKALRAEIDEGEWSKLYSATSQPFDPPKSGKIAVKVINHFGDEVLKVYPVPAKVASPGGKGK